MLYKDLLEFSKERFTEFFKNVPIFENQFTWSPYNEQCYRLMYEENTYDKFATVKDLKEKIPELQELCKKCAAFFIPARNKSMPKYDVILGMQHEEVLMDFLAQRLDTVVERGDLQNRSYPDCRILKADGSIAAYFEVKFHGAPFISALQCTGRYCYEGSATLDYKKIEKQLEIIEKEINVPVYYIHWIEYPCLKGIFCEKSESVKEYIKEQHFEFERKQREGDEQKTSKATYLKKMYSPLLNMMSFEDMISEFESLL